MKQLKKLALILPLTLGLTGCMTLVSLTGGNYKPYRGTSESLSELSGSNEDPLLKLALLVDLPFTIIGDTLLLPVAIYESATDE